MIRTLACLFAITGLITSLAPAALIWRPGEGWVNEGSGQTLAASDAKAALQAARNLESQELYKDALDAYRSITRRWPLSSVAGEAQFKVGLMMEKRAEFWSAYKAYQTVVTKYPGSQFFDLAIERQFSIGNLYLAGEPQKLWKIPLLPSMDKTVEIFETVVKNAPYGTLAAQALFKIGLARENQRNWSAAIASYNKLIDKYPGSDFADDAQYQIGYAWYQAASEPDYDQSAAQKSIEAFQDFMVRFPNSEKMAQAQQYMKELSDRRVQGSMNIAKFYENQSPPNFKAALIYYNDVVQQNPGSELANEAKKRVEALKELVEQKQSVSNPGSSINLSEEKPAASPVL
ncbi:MAG: outer membrane protein assembly factor BamD [Blastochloris sp.]|nr:outer membrane protein assembly factor BamD [Blastochloris sp.]